MAPLPKRRAGNARGRIRTQARRLVHLQSIRCRSCGKLTIPHRVCAGCGFYNGKAVMVKKEKEKTKHENKT